MTRVSHKTAHQNFAILIMPLDLAIALLKKGETGDQILQILDSIVPSMMEETDAVEPTLEEIKF